MVGALVSVGDGAGEAAGGAAHFDVEGSVSHDEGFFRLGAQLAQDYIQDIGGRLGPGRRFHAEDKRQRNVAVKPQMLHQPFQRMLSAGGGDGHRYAPGGQGGKHLFHAWEHGDGRNGESLEDLAVDGYGAVRLGIAEAGPAREILLQRQPDGGGQGPFVGWLAPHPPQHFLCCGDDAALRVGERPVEVEDDGGHYRGDWSFSNCSVYSSMRRICLGIAMRCGQASRHWPQPMQ